MQLVEKYRPRRIDDFIGLAKPKQVMKRLVQKPRQAAFLFTGESGIGKTTMAMALAEAIPAKLHHIGSQECNLERVQEVCRACYYRPITGERFNLILVDEADLMTAPGQNALLSKLDATEFPPDTIWIFTTNKHAASSASRLDRRFRSRCIPVQFSSHGMSGEIAKMLQRIWANETQPNHRQFARNSLPNFARIVKDSKNNIRESLMRLEVELMVIEDTFSW